VCTPLPQEQELAPRFAAVSPSLHFPLHCTLTVALAVPPLLLAAVTTYVPVPAFDISKESLIGRLSPACIRNVSVSVLTVVPLWVTVKVTETSAACEVQLLTVPASVSLLPGLTVAVAAPFAVSVKALHCA